MSKLIDLTGRRFGKLTVIKRAGTYRPPDSLESTFPTWLCKCDCGRETIAYGNNLRAGTTRSCGCLRKKKMKEEFYKNESKT